MSKPDPSLAYDKRRQLQLATELNLCSQCLVHFLGPVNEDTFTLPTSEVHLVNLRNVARALCVAYNSSEYNNEPIVAKVQQNFDTSMLPASPLCPCCFGSLSGTAIADMSEQIIRSLELRNAHSNGKKVPICIEVLVPPIMDALRLTARTVITRYSEKMFAYPALDELLPRVLKRKLGDTLTIVPAAQAKVKITIQAQVHYQSEFCHALWDEFKIKKIKRRFQHPGSVAAGTSAAALAAAEEEDAPIAEEMSRKSVDTLLMHYKSLKQSGLDELEASLRKYIAQLPPTDNSHTNVYVAPRKEVTHRVGWKVTTTACPMYLLGRYRKLARDVPQSPWTVTTSSRGGDDGEGDGDCEEGDRNVQARVDDAAQSFEVSTNTSDGVTTQQYKRKGRSSVEEIVNFAVKGTLQAVDCRMHPCGREDIDVRCLGNGRPFVMEVLDPTIICPDEALLASIVRSINAGEGMNAEKDVEVALLEMADHTVWETMQTKAEEKHKAYTCVVWASCAVTRAMLDDLEALSRSGANVDEVGEPCIELNQKTPLRVLHRRSLLDRKRHVYQIETVLLNEHFFLMNLVTSAGTYVKEFVHGDLGRTSPSICSLFQCQADIMQLDVTWLFDDFTGNKPGGQTYRSTYYHTCTSAADSRKDDSASIAVTDSTKVTWEDLKKIKVPSLKSTASSDQMVECSGGTEV